MNKRIHRSTSPTKVLYQYGNFGSIEYSSKPKNVSRKRSKSQPPVLLEEETFIKKPTCPTKFRGESFANIFTAKKSQDLINKKLVKESWVLLQMISGKVFNIEVEKE